METPIATEIQSPVVIHSYDLLRHLFDVLESVSGRDTTNRRTLAACTRVCRVWHEPAAHVLWRTLPNFHPLWNLLSGRNFSPEAKWLSAYWQFVDAPEFVKDIVEREPERFQHFLHRASHVHSIAVACSQKELHFISALTEHNRGKSILPALHKLSWRHAVPMDTSLLLLGSPSLADLEISISRLGTESNGVHAFAPAQRFDDHHIVDPVFVGLAEAVPHLRRLSIAGREGPGPDLITSLLGLTALRELLVHNQSCSLGPGHVRSIFESLCNLEIFLARIVDFSIPGPSVRAASLRNLRIFGTLDDVMGFLAPGFLELPLLQSLSLRAFADDVAPLARDTQQSHLFSLIASAPFAQSLRSLTVHLLNDAEPFQGPDASDDAACTHAAIIRPIFALKDLEHVDICLGVKFNPIPDADVLEVARAWKHLRSLCLTYHPFLSDAAYPPLAALRYFAEHCPELQELSMTKLCIPEQIDVPAGPRSTPHPLRTLDLRMSFNQDEERSNRLDKVAIARFIDHLFPGLILKTPRPDKLLPASAIFVKNSIRRTLFSWNTIEQEIWSLRLGGPQALEGVGDAVPTTS